MSPDFPQLSRYDVLGRLASGGMAEVWLARAVGVAGFEKLVVLKTILPHLAKDPTFLTMFVNEGRLAARLNHPNCVQIFDLGHEEGILYLAMEYIEGFSLSRVLKRAKDKQIPAGEKIIARIGMDAASGLDYAHRLTERDGTPLKLVHRDVSPDNLLISLSGQTRVVDFGIAKAVTPTLLASGTVAGTVKGKHGFIAPEYLLGEAIDARADIFALGVVLYRALTRKRPFGGNNETEVSLAVIQSTPPAPHQVNPDISPALSDVVMTALRKDPNQRYQTARDLRHAIEAAVGRPADVEEVGDYMTRLWPPGDEERTALSSLASGNTEERSGPALQSVSGTYAGQPNATPSGVVLQATPPTAEELAKQLLTPVRRTSGRLPPVSEAELARRAAPPAAPPAPAPAPTVAIFETPQFDEPKRSSSMLVALLGLLALTATAGFGWMYWKSTQTPTPTQPPVNVAPVAVTEAAAPQLDAGAVAAQPVEAPQAAAGEGTITVETPVSVHVFDGKEDLGATPVTFTRKPGVLTLRLVNKAQRIDQDVKVTVEAGVTRKIDTLERGGLVINAEPWAYVKVDGKSYGQTPVTVKGLYEGPHFVELNNVGLNETRKLEVRVKGGELKNVKVDLMGDE